MNIIEMQDGEGGKWFALAFDGDEKITKWTDHHADAALMTRKTAEALCYRFNRANLSTERKARIIVAITVAPEVDCQIKIAKEIA